MRHFKKIAAALAGLALAPGRAEAALKDIQNVIVIYQENWSFDSLYGHFPNAEGYASVSATGAQVDLSGTPYTAGIPLWEPSVVYSVNGTTSPLAVGQGTAHLPNGPFDLSKYLAPSELSNGDPPHRFYLEQAQMDQGLMDKYVAYASVSGLVMSGYDATELPEGRLAQQYVLCDHFFHGAFGGSFFNHLWLVSAQPAAAPVKDGVPSCYDASGHYVAVTAVAANSGAGGKMDGAYTRDSRYAVNTVQPYALPHSNSAYYLAPLTTTTIGDLLSHNKVAWKWYAGGWDAANANTGTASSIPPWPDKGPLDFQFHHQPFNYWAEFATGASRTAHLADESQFFSDLHGHSLPAVTFIKPAGADNEHPGYASLLQGQQHVLQLVEAIQGSPYWQHSLIIITYDEHGGRWDHMAPPGMREASPEIKAYVAADPARADAWGPGSRVPAILVSPYVHAGTVDHTIYDTTSILALLEDRFAKGQRLGTRDAAVNSLELSLTQEPQGAPAPVAAPRKKGQPVCIFYEKAVRSSHWDIYDMTGQEVEHLDFGADSHPCWDASKAATGTYMIRSTLHFDDETDRVVWNKVDLGT